MCLLQFFARIFKLYSSERAHAFEFLIIENIFLWVLSSNTSAYPSFRVIKRVGSMH